MSTLHDLISWLSKLPPEMPVRFNNGKYPGTFGSWRGDYSHLSLSQDGKAPPSAQALYEAAHACVGEEFEGYKGGKYRMEGSTELHADDYGECSDTAADILGGKVVEGWAVIIRRGSGAEGWTT